MPLKPTPAIWDVLFLSAESSDNCVMLIGYWRRDEDKRAGRVKAVKADDAEANPQDFLNRFTESDLIIQSPSRTVEIAICV